MKATILTIGDELLIGQVVNTNASWLGEQVSLLGIDVAQIIMLGDDDEAIHDALARSHETTDLIILTGGLGPTHDDLTVEAVAHFFSASLHTDQAILDKITARFERRNRTMPEANRKLALVPEGFEVLANTVGTAPGLWFANGDEHIVVILPGVPREMKAIFEQGVVPRLRQRKGLRAIRHRTLLTTGIGESNLQEKIGDLSEMLGPSLRLAYLPSTRGVRLRLTAMGEDNEAVEGSLDRLEARLREKAGRYIYGMGDDSLEAVLGRLLTERDLTVAVAESCTGGHVLNLLTNIPGSSAYVVGGVVAYANSVKQEQLGVSADVLAAEGAVSEAVVLQMAEGVRTHLGADIGLATTGVAGPGGGTADKPVGTVWIGYADADGSKALLLRLTHDREMNKELSSTGVLELVRRQVLGKGPRS
ncbi:MAG TPA: competence/damage-inducible protein A [Rhodothermales bacterium]|nr:competence/damage-inducible protein A [Rhodothermales bacterium]